MGRVAKIFLNLLNDGNIVLGGLELPQGDIDGNTSLSLGLELIENPGIRGAFS